MFTLTDGIVAVVLLISAGMAFIRGFVHEVLSIGAWIGAAVVCLYGFDYAQPWFMSQIGVAWAANLAAGAALFLVSLLVLSILTKAVANQVKKSALNSVDSSLGFVFGLLRGALILSAAYYIAVSWIFDTNDLPHWIADAKTRPWLARGAEEIARWRPRSLGSGSTSALQPLAVPAASTATGDLTEDSKRGAAELLGETPATVESLTTPKVAEPLAQQDKNAKTKGYDKDERRAMDRLIRNTQ